MDWSQAPDERELAEFRRTLRTEHVVVARDFVGVFGEFAGWLVGEAREVAGVYAGLGNPGPGSNLIALASAERVRASCAVLGVERHPVLASARRVFEALWDRLALTLWEHAEQGVAEHEAFLAEALQWAESDDPWAGWHEQGWSAGLPPAGDLMARLDLAVNEPVGFGELDWMARGAAAKLVTIAGRALSEWHTVYRCEFVKRAERVAEAVRPLPVEHAGEPLGDLHAMQARWVHHLLLLVEEFHASARVVGSRLITAASRYESLGLWMFGEF